MKSYIVLQLSVGMYLINCLINDLASRINALGLGIDIGDGKSLSILLYADYIVY